MNFWAANTAKNYSPVPERLSRARRSPITRRNLAENSLHRPSDRYRRHQLCKLHQIKHSSEIIGERRQTELVAYLI